VKLVDYLQLGLLLTVILLAVAGCLGAQNRE
jgi:hypothetical protein